MQKALAWARNGLALVGVLALGFWLGSGRTVKAASDGWSGGVQFQLAGVNERSSLLVYGPGSKTVYVYQGATTGNSALQCSFMFRLDRPGGVIQRVPCQVGRLIP
ncbi:MAG TPA: hypothetical protein VGS10_16500 [Terracidiphilus sp.]|nr:hypothetical protein [Terracidiphilus sp.]